MDPITADELSSRLDAHPRVELGAFPTPLEREPLAARFLGLGGDLWIKRDDLTGLYFGGNKTRQLEYTLGEARSLGCDTVLIGIAPQSNHARQMVAAARRLGMEPIAVMPRSDEPLCGNYLLTRLGGRVEWVKTKNFESDMSEAVSDIAESLRRRGRKTYQLTVPDAGPLGAMGMARGFVETFRQIRQEEIAPGALVVSSAGPTAAGIAWANKALHAGWRIIATAPILWSTFTPEQYILRCAAALDEMTNLPVKLNNDDFICRTDFLDAGYQQASPELLRFVREFLLTSGVLIDAAYVGKAALAIRTLAPRGEFGDRPVLLWHTGGTPALCDQRLWNDLL